jgi:MFS family permease
VDESATGSVNFFSLRVRSSLLRVSCSREDLTHILATMRRLLVLVSTIIFVDVMLFTALTPLIPGYAEEFDLSKTGAGVLVGAFGAGAIIGGVIGGIAAARLGPKHAVITGLLLLGLASVGFAAADSAATLSAARFVQGLSSTITWAGGLTWLALNAPRERRGEVIGIAFSAAVFGAVLGPIFGGLADVVGTRPSFAGVAVVAFACAGVASLPRASAAEAISLAGLSRALRDPRFLGGLWLNTLPAFLFGMLVVLGPLALDAGGWSALAIAVVFFVAGLLEAALGPIVGRVTDRRGRLLPIRVALAASIVVAAGLAAATEPLVIAFLVGAAALGFGGFYTPGMALTSHRADAAGLAQGLAFGVMNSAWAVGEMTGPVLSGALASAFGDAVPYLTGSGLCMLTLVATQWVAGQRMRPREA